MYRTITIAAACALVAGCNASKQSAQAEEVPSALQSGEYELAWTDLKTSSSDKKLADANVAALMPARACVAAGGRIESAAFAEKGDHCRTMNSYVRNGIVNVQLLCSREGKGSVSQVVSGSFRADSFKADVQTTTTFAGGANFTRTGKIAARRVGDCPAKDKEATES
jgi:hypothetical protein